MNVIETIIGARRKKIRAKIYLHKKRIGYIEDYDTFHCVDSDLMTLEVMEAIVNHWKVYRHDLEEISI